MICGDLFSKKRASNWPKRIRPGEYKRAPRRNGHLFRRGVFYCMYRKVHFYFAAMSQVSGERIPHATRIR